MIIAFALLVAGCDTPDRGPRPNVVLIVADDLGYADSGTWSPGGVPTPALDRLAAQGVRFTSAYVAAATCGPSRAALFTGTYPQRLGFEFNTGPPGRTEDQGLGLSPGSVTLATRLQEVGYETALVGKWHLGSDDARYPMARGFDHFVGVLAGETAYVDPDHPDAVTVRLPAVPLPDGSSFPNNRHTRGAGFEVVAGPDREVVDNFDRYLTDALSDEAVAFVEAATPPFFLTVSYTAPHAPFQATRAAWERFAHIEDPVERAYAAMIHSLDEGIGRVLDALDDQGVAEDTLVVFLSDNGCATYTGVCACTPVRGGKGAFLDGGVRVPLLVRWPGGLRAGATHAGVVSSLDLAPTVLRAVGIRRLPRLDGEDLLPLVLGDRGRARPLFWRTGTQRAALVDGHKLWSSEEAGFLRLYDLTADPTERDDVAQDQPERVAAVRGPLAAWEASLRAPAWGPWTAGITDQCGEMLTVYP